MNNKTLTIYAKDKEQLKQIVKEYTNYNQFVEILKPIKKYWSWFNFRFMYKIQLRLL